MLEVEIGVVTLVIATLVAWGTTSLVIQLAPRIGAIDHPGPRKIHRSPIPRIGGVSVFLGFAVATAFATYASGREFKFSDVSVYWSVLALAAAAMFFLGLVDDLRGLSFRAKFVVQIAAAIAVWFGGFKIDVLGLPFGFDAITLGWASLPVTVLWIVGIVNAINLIDGLDGLAAGTALIMTLTVAVIALKMGHYGVVAASVALVGSLIGFLIYNFNPARVFLGDSGSMFLGFVLAVISIRGSTKGTTAVAVLTPLLVLGLPILDTSVAILRRLIRITTEDPGQRRRVAHVVNNAHRVFLPDRGHLHHRLLDLGLSHRTAVLVLYGVVAGMAMAALAVVVRNSVALAGVLLGVVAILTAAFIGFILTRHRRRQERHREAAAEIARFADAEQG